MFGCLDDRYSLYCTIIAVNILVAVYNFKPVLKQDNCVNIRVTSKSG